VANAPHHKGTFQTRSLKVRAAANGDPFTRCWRCGQLARLGDPWQAGHLVDGAIDSPLAAEHRSCNIKAGNRLKARRYLRTSRAW
jgi:hypothetical protein